MSYQSEMLVQGEWSTNSLRFATKEEAKGYSANLLSRWTMPSASRETESSDPVSHSWNIETGELTSLDSGFSRVPPRSVRL